MRTDVSRVSDANRSHTSAGTAVLTKTVCAMPVPSRTTANATFPEDRRWVTQPCSVTVEPTWLRSSAMRRIESCMRKDGACEEGGGEEGGGQPIEVRYTAGKRMCSPSHHYTSRRRNCICAIVTLANQSATK